MKFSLSTFLIGLGNGWLLVELFGPLPDIAILGWIVVTCMVMAMEDMGRDGIGSESV